MTLDWSPEEVAATVAAYLRMLTMELAGQSYNKTEHRRALQVLLTNRSEAAIEAVDLPAEVPVVGQFEGIRVDPPALQVKTEEPTVYYPPVPSHRDYLAREARNRSLGCAGEEFVVLYERWRLTQLGRERLAAKIEHTAADRGDGAGYDVLSFEEDGRERFIEVKTTAYAKDTPFFITDSELSFDRSHEQAFRVYRLFEFRRTPKLFELRGRPDRHCRLDPVLYRASFS